MDRPRGHCHDAPVPSSKAFAVDVADAPTSLTVRVGDEVFAATPGSFVFCPRRVPHLLTVESDEVRMLTLCTPGGVEGLFVELGEPAQARTLPPEGDEPDVARVITLAAHYGAEVLADWPEPSGR